MQSLRLRTVFLGWPGQPGSSALSALLGLTMLLVPSGCGPSSNLNNPPDPQPDSGAARCDPAADDDNDCIPNGVEGCTEDPPADRDRDGRPNHFDSDADNDGIPDDREVGPDCAIPRDTDGDSLPDYLDGDSDNDSVRDQYEDRNGDGRVGTCETPCASDGACDMAAGERCSLPRQGNDGVCVSFDCLGGETDPRSTDTDGDGIPDAQEGTFICNPRSEENPYGVKRLVYADSANTIYTSANWRLALEPEALQNVPAIQSPGPLDSAYVFDLSDPTLEVAGFLVSRAAGSDSAVGEASSLIGVLSGAAQIQSVTPRVSGTPTTSLDGYDSVVSATLELRTVQPVDVTALRAAMIPLLLGRDAGAVNIPAPGWAGGQATDFVVVYQTVYRADAEQTLYMGAVTRRSAYDDRTRNTALHADDISNGTGHSVSGNPEALECETFRASQQPKADIIWVMDESASVNDDRERIASAAADFFTQAVTAGLDFRMGVTDMNDTGPGGQPGIFASRQAGGTGDRWLLPDEPGVFADNIIDPSGPDAGDLGREHGLTQARAAFDRHLPRDSSNPRMIREDAQLVVLFVSDEKPEEVKDRNILGNGNQEPTPAQQSQIDSLLAPYIADFQANDAVAHLIAEPLPFDEPCSDLGEHAYGYYELVSATGGQTGSICQADLRLTIDAIIDSIVGTASPVVLSTYPISASIAVTRDNVVVPRSRLTGWDYRGASNAIVFFNMPFDPDNPSDVVVSYRRWAEQVGIE